MVLDHPSQKKNCQILELLRTFCCDPKYNKYFLKYKRYRVNKTFKSYREYTLKISAQSVEWWRNNSYDKFKFNQCSCQEQFYTDKIKSAQLVTILNILARFSEWFKSNSYENLNSISLAKINNLFTTKHHKKYTLKITAHFIEHLRIDSHKNFEFNR